MYMHAREYGRLARWVCHSRALAVMSTAVLQTVTIEPPEAKEAQICPIFTLDGGAQSPEPATLTSGGGSRHTPEATVGECEMWGSG